MGSLLIDDFSGGLNLRDSPNQVAPNETSFANNWTLDERGSIVRRKGHTNVVALPGTNFTNADIFYSEALNLWLCARTSAGTYRLFSRPGDLSGSWTDRGQIASAVTARAVFADWPGATPYAIILTNVADATNGGLYTLDSTPTLTKRFATQGVAIAVWQNKVWFATTGAGFEVRIYFSPVGDPTTWTSSIDLRDKDASPLTALGVAGGALVAFKKRSTYRINDSSNGAYSTIDTAAGCVNPRAVVGLEGRLYAWGVDALYECDGVGRLKNVADKLRPLFTGMPIVAQALVVGGVYQDRLLFGGTTISPVSQNNLVEIDPRIGWGMEHAFASVSQNNLSSLASQTGTLYGAIIDGDNLFSMFTATAGADDGTVFQSQWLTPWMLPNSGMLARLSRLRVQGLIQSGSSAVLELSLRKGWDSSTGDVFDITSALLGSSGLQQRATDLQSLGHSDAFAVLLTAKTATGAVQIRALQLIDQTLQWPNPGYPRGQTSGQKKGGDYTGQRDPPAPPSN